MSFDRSNKGAAAGGKYFKAAEWNALSSDEQQKIIESQSKSKGDDHLCYSFKNPGNNEVKKLWNLAFCEVRTGVENSYQRTGAWFPLIGNDKHKLP